MTGRRYMVILTGFRDSGGGRNQIAVGDRERVCSGTFLNSAVIKREEMESFMFRMEGT